MRILLIGYGSRGDVQPLVMLGQGLKQAGYDVAIGAGVNFRQMVADAGLGFEAFDTDIEALMNSEMGKAWANQSSGSTFTEAQNMKRVADAHVDGIGQVLLTMAEKYDVLVSGLMVFLVVDAVCHKLGKKHITVNFAPFAPTKDAHATLVPMVPRRNIFLNRLSGYMGQYFIYWAVQEASNRHIQAFGFSKKSFKDFLRAYNREVPVIHAISPLVMPKPADWDDKKYVAGYWLPQSIGEWKPSAELSQFLAQGERPIYIGFGSMPNNDPDGMIRMIVDALNETGQRGIIASGWAGFEAESLPDNILLLKEATPHNWLFPQMAGVIHHGGAGTTAEGLRAGVPQGIVSHFADQPYWGNRMNELGVAGKYIKRHQLSREWLIDTIREMTGNPDLQAHAKELGAALSQEDGIDNAVNLFEKLLK